MLEVQLKMKQGIMKAMIDRGAFSSWVAMETLIQNGG